MERDRKAERSAAERRTLQQRWLWLLVCPLERCLVLSDQEMCAALRHQYGLPPKAGAPWYCRCGGRVAHGHLHALLSLPALRSCLLYLLARALLYSTTNN